jgi:hypothetical protein
MVTENYGFKLNTITDLDDNAHLIHPLDKDKAYASMNMAILGTSDSYSMNIDILSLTIASQ